MTKFDIIALNAKQPQTRNHKAAIKYLLLRDNAAVYARIENYLTVPGVAGRAQFDQALTADVIKQEADKLKATDADAAIVAELSHADIWRHVPSILSAMGLDIRRGKIAGLLEDRTDEDDLTPEVVEVAIEAVAPVQAATIQ
jgi:hypothetical protein